jgi:cytochrome c oxidase subunit I+III
MSCRAGNGWPQVLAAVLFVVDPPGSGRTDRDRRNSFDFTALLARYAVAQTLLGLALLHRFPRLRA